MRRRHNAISGTVNQRSNGRFTAVAPPVLDISGGGRPRKSLGTFDTREEAEIALRRWALLDDESNEKENSNTKRIDDYMYGWLAEVIDRPETSGELAPSTASDYRRVVSNHIVP